MTIQRRKLIKSILVLFAADELYTTSLIVAKVFGKEHKHVLEAIRDLYCSSDFRRLNFRLTSRWVDMPNGAQRKEDYYEITRDGCMFLIMGFTGEKAAQWKENFIAEFNRMGEKLYKKEQLDISIQRLETLPVSMLGFEQLSLKDRKVQQNHFHQIFRSFGLTKGRLSHVRIKMCAAVNLVINGMSSYRFRQLTEINGKTRDWMPKVNQYALYRTEFDLLQMCIEWNYQVTFDELERAYVELARLNKQIVEFSYHVQLHDTILDHVRDVLAEARQQLQNDKVSPYQITEGQLYHEMEQRALLLDELTQKLAEPQS